MRRRARRGAGRAAACISISRDAIQRLGANVIRERYGNLFEMYERITGENPYQVPMRIYPAIHYTMGGSVGGLQSDEHDSGAVRDWARRISPITGRTGLGASALMQGLADGYFVIPYTMGDYLASVEVRRRSTTSHPEFEKAVEKCRRHRQAAAGDQGQAHGRLVPSGTGQDRCGSTAAWRGPRRACEQAIGEDPRTARRSIWKNVHGAGQRRRAEPIAGEGGPRGRFSWNWAS